MDWRLEGASVLRGRLTVPLGGAWVADLEVDTAEPLLGAVTRAVTLAVGTTSWNGMVFRGGVTGDRWSGRIVGGAGGLRLPVEARAWQGLQPARGLLVELLADVGETLAPTSTSEVATNLPRWSRCATTADRALADLAAHLGCRWRVRPEGDVWVGVDAWAPVEFPDGSVVELLDVDPRTDAAVYALPEARVLPGTTFDGRRVGGVVYDLDGPRERVTVWRAPA